MPWGQYSSENLEIDKAKQILNEDHYGLDDIKDRILVSICNNDSNIIYDYVICGCASLNEILLLRFVLRN